MKFKKDFAPSLAGTLLVAHPSLLDPNYKRSVILISSDAPDGTAMGIVVNSPLGLTMGEFDTFFESSPLAQVPMYMGGPIENNLIILTAWQWIEHQSVFRLEFGITEEKAIKLATSNPDVEVRAFLGYSGWTHAQLIDELKHHAWLLSSVKHLAKEGSGGFHLWQNIIKTIKPDLFFLAQTPEDPSEN